MVTIIGAGLCGLAIAYRLKQAGVPFCLYEASPNIGGRIQSAGEHQDLGPSWVWPYAQPTVSSWLNELNINTFAQFDDGDALIDASASELPKRQFLAGQHGMVRVQGGTFAIVKSLHESLGEAVQVSSKVCSCVRSGNKVGLEVRCNDELQQIDTDTLIIATPPRVAAALLPNHDPSLAALIPKLNQAPTWMAPHAKVVIHYASAFWRNDGLSGRVASHVGPLVEIHDHCGPDGSPAALFGFAGVPFEDRKNQALLEEQVHQQLVRCFGHDAPTPEQVTIKDWAFEPAICTDADLTGPMSHPSVLDSAVRQSHWDKSLWMAGSETSSTSPGLIDGALARADEICAAIIG